MVRRNRPEVTSWATPIVVKVDGKPRVIASGTRRVRGYGLADGKVIWQCAGLSTNIVASPVSSGGIVYAGSSYVKQGMLAIRLTGAKGDITGSDHVIWSRRRNTPHVPSPLLYGQSLHFLHHYQPIMSRLDVKTGKDPESPYRLPGIRNVYASPVDAANRVYITDRTGTTLVLSHDKKIKLLALNRLDESINASAAIVGGEIFLRADRHLYCIAEQAAKKTPATATATDQYPTANKKFPTPK